MSHTDENWQDLVRALHVRPDQSQETSGCAGLAITNRLLLEAVEFMDQNAKLLEKHSQRLDALEETQQGHAVDHDSYRERLDALDKQVELLPAYINVQQAHAACIDADRKRLDALEAQGAAHARELAQHCLALKTGQRVCGDGDLFNAIGARLDALEQERQTGMSAPPEPIGQAWVYREDNGQVWLNTLIVETTTNALPTATAACKACAGNLFYPGDPPPGRPVLVNLVPVESDERKDASA